MDFDSKKDFLNAAGEMIHWAASHLFDPASPEEGQLPFSSPKPGSTYQKLSPEIPTKGSDLQRLWSEFQSVIEPGIIPWNHPQFFGYFPCNTSPPAALAGMIASAININPFSWKAGPSATELEAKLIEWICSAFQMNGWTGCLQETATMGGLCALYAAREKKHPVNVEGMQNNQKPLVIYASEHTHSSIIKSGRLLGFGDKHIRFIPTNNELAIDSDKLKAQIDLDLQNGFTPTAIVATIGTTSTMACDDISAISDISREYDLWLHVDAAMAGVCMFLPEYQSTFKGVESADSMSFNPHKWLMSGFPCSVLLVKDSKYIKQSQAIDPEYLKGQGIAEFEDYKDWTFQLGRDFRALRLWMVLKYYGQDGIQKILRHHMDLAKEFASFIKTQSKLTLFEEPHFNLVCFHLNNNDETTAYLEKLQESGKFFIEGTKINEKFLIRVAIGQTLTNNKHMEILKNEIQNIEV